MVAAASPQAGAGRLLLGFEALTYDGPWVNEEDLRKFNGVLRYSQGDSASGFNVTLMGYDSDWTATDQVPERAVESGEIDRFGTLDPTDGGETSRFSLSANVRRPFGNGQAQMDAYVVRYAMDLWSNFTYALDDPLTGAPNGDQFKQVDRRTVYGMHPRYAWSGTLGAAETTNTIGLQVRYDDIRRVGLYSTNDRDIVSTTREDSVDQLSVGIYLENATQWQPWLRSILGVRADWFSFDDDDPAGDRIPGALERMAQIGITVEDFSRWFGSIQLRYLGSRPLIEDNSVRSDSTTITNARVGYKLTNKVRVQLDVLNVFGSKDSDIAYFYASCLPSELGSPACPAVAPRDGIEDIHSHPVEPRQFRLTLIGTF